MPEITDITLKEMVDIIVEEFHPEKIVLFGSRARGDSTDGSDIDLMVIDSKPFDEQRSRFKEMGRMWHAIRKFCIPVDILLYSTDEVERWKNSINHVIARALREGKVLYG
jgi:uncharacterized protein